VLLAVVGPVVFVELYVGKERGGSSAVGRGRSGCVRGIVCRQVLRKILEPLKFPFTLDNFGCHFI